MSKLFLFVIVGLTAFVSAATPREIFFIRHGEAEHNVLNQEGRSEEAKKIRDPRLTPVGIHQAQMVGKDLATVPVDLVLVSPMFRTLQTAEYIFEQRPIHFVADANLAEFCHSLICMGSDGDFLRSSFPKVDFGSLPSRWYNDFPNESLEHFKRRIEKFKQTLISLNEHTVIVVSHSGFLKELLGVGFRNCDVVRAKFGPNGQLAILNLGQ